MTRIREQQPSRPKAVDLVHSAERPVRPVDLNGELAYEDWDTIYAEMEKNRASNWYLFSLLAMHLVLLFPERRQEIKLAESQWTELYDRVEMSRGRDWPFFSSHVKILLTLFPERRDQLNLDEGVKNGIQESVERYRETDLWTQSGLIVDLIIMFPELRNNYSRDITLKQSLQKGMDFYKSEPAVNLHYVVLAARFSVIFPQDKHDLQIDDKLWEEIYIERRQQRGSRVPELAELSLNAAILDVDEVSITRERGLELINREAVEPRSLPVRTSV